MESGQYVKQYKYEDWIYEKYELYKSILFRIAFSYLGNKQDTDDILQEAFIKLYYSAPVFPSDEDEKRWIIQVTINLCKKHLKTVWHRNIRCITDFEEFITEQKDQEDFLEILSLPSKYKILIHLYYFEGYNNAEIAEILRLSIATIKMRLKRGCELSKIEFEDYYEISKYRELFSKLDADAATYKLIRSKLKSYHGNEKNIQGYRYKPAPVTFYRKTFNQIISRISVLRTALPSLAFLMFLLAALIVFKIQFISETVSDKEDFAETLLPTAADADVAGIYNNVIDSTETGRADIEYDKSAKEGDFYFAWFHTQGNSSIVTKIDYFIFSFYGTVISMDPNKLTDVVVTKDGIPTNNSIEFYAIAHGIWNNLIITNFYFEFTDEVIEPGIYGVTGKYEGVPFKADEQLIEAAINKEPADPDDLLYIAWSGYSDDTGKFITNGIDFMFSGLQNSFYLTDLTELKLTNGTDELSFSLMNYTRNSDIGSDMKFYTIFSVNLKEKITESGNYYLTGEYKGKAFKSIALGIP